MNLFPPAQPVQPVQDLPYVLWSDIKLNEKIGEGTFGTVHIGTLRGNETVAVKVLGFEEYPVDLGEPSNLLAKNLTEEAQVMLQIQTENVVKLIGVCMDKGNYSIVMEYMPRGTLPHVLQTLDRPLSWPERLLMCLDAARGLRTIHHPHGGYPARLHGHLSSDAFLVNSDLRVKLSDFCTTKTRSSIKRKGRRGRRSTVAYLAPEHLQKIHEAPDYSSEVYSFGVIMWEIVSQRIAHQESRGVDESAIRRFVLEEGGREDLPADCSPQLKDIIDKCRSREVRNRPQMTGPVCAPSDAFTRISNDDISMKEEIGKGTFGTVYLANYRGAQVAVKKLGFEDYPWRLPEPARVLRESVLEEAAIMQQIQAEHVVRLIGVCLEPANYILVMEYMPRGSLLKLLLSNEPLSWPQLLQFSTDAARGLCAIHHPSNCPQRVHGNLTTSTYLLDANMRVKVSDFCTTKTKSSVKRYSKFRRGRSTVAYVAPENLKDINAGQTQAAEVFSFGIVLWEIASRKLAHEAIRYEENQIHKFVLEERRKEDIPADCNKSLAAIIERCRKFEGTERPKMLEVVKLLENALLNCPS
ncbi:MLKL [Branchiostoma lanceolatum]|uniref:MLKL protein n=1 Tax=Branchiostoma lanceolatum TaxID=7740 RepID=A0A8K0A6K1_BRALA|nr:MLKL [Branchiostoma lanceolatum]